MLRLHVIIFFSSLSVFLLLDPNMSMASSNAQPTADLYSSAQNWEETSSQSLERTKQRLQDLGLSLAGIDAETFESFCKRLEQSIEENNSGVLGLQFLFTLTSMKLYLSSNLFGMVRGSPTIAKSPFFFLATLLFYYPSTIISGAAGSITAILGTVLSAFVGMPFLKASTLYYPPIAYPSIGALAWGALEEELVFRAFMQQMAGSMLNRVGATHQSLDLYLSSVFFGSIHTLFEPNLRRGIFRGISATFGGLIYGYLFQNYGLGASVTAHFLHNLFLKMI